MWENPISFDFEEEVSIVCIPNMYSVFIFLLEMYGGAKEHVR